MIFKLVPDAFFGSAKAISTFIDMDLKLMMKMVDKSNGRT